MTVYFFEFKWWHPADQRMMDVHAVQACDIGTAWAKFEQALLPSAWAGPHGRIGSLDVFVLQNDRAVYLIRDATCIPCWMRGVALVFRLRDGLVGAHIAAGREGVPVMDLKQEQY